AAAAGTALGAAVTAVDGWVYVSQFAGAAAPPNPAPATSPSFSHDIVRIFTSNGPKTCARVGCHSGPNPTGGQNLEAASAYANIVNVPSNEKPALLRIKPGDAANSYLFQKITGAPGLAGSRMPTAGGPPAAGDIEPSR